MGSPAEKNWYVLYTKPRHEKKVAKRLSQAGHTTYCPLYKVKRQWSDRTKVVEESLFRSYIFIHIEDHKREEVFTFPGTVRYLFWLRKVTGIDSLVERVVDRIGENLEQVWILGSLAQGINSDELEVLLIGQNLNEDYIKELMSKVEKHIDKTINYQINTYEETTQTSNGLQVWVRTD